MPESARTTATWALRRYGGEKVIASLRSSVMVKPFQMQSMFLVFSSSSLAFQSMGWSLRSRLRRAQASLARSMS